MNFKEQVKKDNLPRHIAIIMDGNGRWAKKKGNNRIFGHKNGVKAVRQSVETAARLGVECLTLYAFSTENWNRPRFEVDALMALLISTIHSETKTLLENNVQLKAIGDLDSLPKKVRKELNAAIEKTASNDGLSLILALSYSSRWEITEAVRKISEMISAGAILPENIDSKLINSQLCTAEFPELELLIRTSGEHRLSNFLLWQSAYAELYFTDKFWPDFREEDLCEAIVDYQSRERRFGKISEQL